MSCRIKSTLFDNLAISAAWRCCHARDSNYNLISHERPRIISRGGVLRARRSGSAPDEAEAACGLVGRVREVQERYERGEVQMKGRSK